VRKGAIAEPRRRTISVRVSAGRHASLVGTYGSIINPGVKTLRGRVVSVTGPSGDPAAIVLGGRQVFARGAILSLPPSVQLPRGLLSHVLAVSYGAGKTTVSLRAASIYKVAPSFHFDVPLADSQVAAAALTAGCGGPSGVSPYRRIRDISFSGGWNTVSLLHIPVGVRASVHFTTEAGVKVTGGLGLDCSLQVSISANGMAGPIPVTAAIQGELTAFAGVGGILESGGSLHVDAGASTIGTPPALLWVPEVLFSNPKFSLTAQRFAQATAGIGVAMKLGVGNDNAASATLNLGSSVDFSAQRGACSWDARFGQFSAEGKLLRWNIETPKTPALFTKQLWRSACGSGTGSGGGGSGSGGGGGVGGGGSVGGGTAQAISFGYQHACVLLRGGNAECWGDNVDGQLGDGTGISTTRPVPVYRMSEASEIAGGGANTCALLTAGSVECWGMNLYGQLGIGTNTGPQRCDVGFQGESPCSLSPVTVAGISDANGIAVGGDDVCAVLATGGVDCWGSGTTSPAPVNGIASAVEVSLVGAGGGACARLAIGEVDCWGNEAIPGFGGSTPIGVDGITNATAISAGYGSVCALLSTGEVDCWGVNRYGSLGDGTTNDSATPVRVAGISNATAVSAGGDFACAVLAGGGIECWGFNGSGQLGNGSHSGPELCEGVSCGKTPVRVAGITNAVVIATGGGGPVSGGSCSLLSDGAVVCWGNNESGQLGDGTTTNSDMPVRVLGYP
jgi:uncharacterized membrane protein YgcG